LVLSIELGQLLVDSSVTSVLPLHLLELNGLSIGSPHHLELGILLWILLHHMLLVHHHDLSLLLLLLVLRVHVLDRHLSLGKLLNTLHLSIPGLSLHLLLG
jgi:hypothetical protein